jgi:hypothetical protein
MSKTFFAVRFVLACLGIYHLLSSVLGSVNEIIPLPYWSLPVIFVPLVSLFNVLERRFQRDE